MKILVTGAAGFIGSHLAEQLNQQGHQVRAIDSMSDFLYPKEIKERNILNFKALGIEFSPTDIRSSEMRQIVRGCDYVINEAAIPGLVKSWKHVDEYFEANVLGLQNLLEACAQNEVKKLIQVSTSSVYGKDAVGDEASATNPYSPYGVSKLAAEKLAQAYSENFGLQINILRYYSVYGPRQRPDMAYFKFIEAIANGTKFEVFGDGMQTRTKTFVTDITRATASFLTAEDKEACHIYNLSGRESIKLIDAIRIIEEITGKTAKFEYQDGRAGDQRETRGICTKAETAIGYSPLTTFRQGIEKQIEWQLWR